MTLEAPPGPAGRRRGLGRRVRTAAPRQCSGAEPGGRPRGHRRRCLRAASPSRAPNDEQVRVPANGFSIAGDPRRNRPMPTAKPRPAVVLVGGSGPTDRDETIAGIPIFGQIANALADAGFYVLRYDKRGVGQSGGRPEAATLDDYAEDLRAAVRYLGGRKDVDRRRIAVVGYARRRTRSRSSRPSKDDRIAAAVLIASIGTNGRGRDAGAGDAQPRAIDASGRRKGSGRSTLQKQIQTAVLTGNGWEGDLARGPPAGRHAVVPQLADVRSGEDHARRRTATARRARRRSTRRSPPIECRQPRGSSRGRAGAVPVEVVKVPGINHLLVPATTGERRRVRNADRPHRQRAVSPARCVERGCRRRCPPPRPLIFATCGFCRPLTPKPGR